MATVTRVPLHDRIGPSGRTSWHVRIVESALRAGCDRCWCRRCWPWCSSSGRRRRPGSGPAGGPAGPGGGRAGRADGAGPRLLGARPLAGAGPAEPRPDPPQPGRPARRPASSDGRPRVAAILGGLILAWGMFRTLRQPRRDRLRLLLVRQPGHDRSIGRARASTRSSGWPCWERSTGSSHAGSDWIAGFWASLAFLAGGWPPLVADRAGRDRRSAGAGSSFSLGLLLPPLVTAIVWSVADDRHGLRRILGRGADPAPDPSRRTWSLARSVLLLGLPWTPFALLALSRSIRGTWPAEGRAWVTGWLQAALASLIAGTFVPGLEPAARMIALAGVLVGAAACLESVWDLRSGPPPAAPSSSSSRPFWPSGSSR